MPERRLEPFPDIPRFPEKPKLEGAPHEAHESALLAREEGLPMLDVAGEDLKRFEELTQSERRRGLQRERFKRFARTPEGFEEYFDTLRILEERWEEKRAAASAFVQLFEENAERYARETGEYNAPILKKLLELSVKSHVYKNVAEAILKGFYRSASGTRKAMDFLYTFTQATLESDDQEVFRRGAEILCCGTDVFLLNDPAVLDYITAPYVDDETLRKFFIVDSFLSHYGERYAPEARSRFNQTIERVSSTQSFKDSYERFRRRDSDKAARIERLWEAIRRGRTTFDMGRMNEWPYRLAFQERDEVRRLFNERLAIEEGRIAFSLPGRGEFSFEVSSPQQQDEISHFIREDLRQIPEQGQKMFQERSYLAALYYI